MNETHWHAEWCWLTGLWCVRLLPIGVCLNFAREWKPRASACDPISDSEVVFLLWDVLYMICLAIHEGCKSAGICSKTSLPSAEINLAELIDTMYRMRPVPSGKGYINVLEPKGHTLQVVDSRALLTSSLHSRELPCQTTYRKHATTDLEQMKKGLFLWSESRTAKYERLSRRKCRAISALKAFLASHQTRLYAAGEIVLHLRWWI